MICFNKKHKIKDYHRKCNAPQYREYTSNYHRGGLLTPNVLLPKQELLMHAYPQHCMDCWYIQALLPPSPFSPVGMFTVL